MTRYRADDARASRRYLAKDEGCVVLVVTIFIFGLVAVLFCGVTFDFIQVPFLPTEADVLADQREKWDAHLIESYELEVYKFANAGLVFMVHTIVVDGEIVSQDAGTRIIVQGLYTVDWPFEQASKCRRFCTVDYDSIYGFPALISGGFIESSTITVMSFRVIE